MPIFFQHPINDFTRLGIWKIEETEEFFRDNVPQHRNVTHPHKRLQHLAGRFLLQYLFPDFPYELIKIADTRKPFLPNEQYHFSISHCGDYAAAIVSKNKRVGVDIEIPVDKISRVKEKFLSEEEQLAVGSWQLAAGSSQSTVGSRESELSFNNDRTIESLTVLWSAKEAIFKWYGNGGVDFRENIRLNLQSARQNQISTVFIKDNNSTSLSIEYRLFNNLVLAWTMDDIAN